MLSRFVRLEARLSGGSGTATTSASEAVSSVTPTAIPEDTNFLYIEINYSIFKRIIFL